MKRMITIVLLLFICLWSQAPAQESPAPAHQHELKQGQPTVEEEGKETTIPELEAFHESLHPLVHDLMPANDLAGVRAKLPDLLKSAKAVAAAKLPAGLAAGEKQYRKAGKQLVAQVGKLQKTKDDKAFEKLFDEMHMTFEHMMEMSSSH
jgi:hypothetical protein